MDREHAAGVGLALLSGYVVFSTVSAEFAATIGVFFGLIAALGGYKTPEVMADIKRGFDDTWDQEYERGNMPATMIVALASLVAVALLVILLGEIRTETVRPIAVNASNTTASSDALAFEKQMWPIAAVGGATVLVAYGVIVEAVRSGGGPR